ncbi:FliG C-terminal domain-containing protein [Yoonia maritima]|uniref:FliG C-terminal domain-containing protein n=1 Tax=Yoonia maritima TaxID=1435347 RepID=UPI000D101084|nr:FliG C-terminal domain-containing protein [Yoonia maritima]
MTLKTLDLSTPAISRRRKAAMIVQMMISDGGNLSLSQLPESLQELLTEELGAIRLVDRTTVASVAKEFTTQLEAVGMTAPGSRDNAINALSEHLTPSLAERLQAQTDTVRHGDHWPIVSSLSTPRIVDIMTSESVEISAVVLSKLPVGKAAEVLTKTPGERARRITYAMSLTAKVAPDVVHRIGQSLAKNYATPANRAFENAPVERLGAILNSTVAETRESLLEGLDSENPEFATDLRKAIFTFKDIPARIKPADISACLRPVDAETLARAIAAALADEGPLSAAAEFILGNVSQRMSAQMREDAEETGAVKKADAETAMSAVTAAIRELAETGTIEFIDPGANDNE